MRGSCVAIEKEGSVTNADRSAVQRAFDAYVAAFDMSDTCIAMKYDHTMRVAKLCEKTASAKGMSAADVDTAWLCGLLHDIGRFEQLRIWRTFKDAASCSHARLGLAVLDGDSTFNGKALAGADGRMKLFCVDGDIVAIVRSAVALHSDLSLPDDLDARTRCFCEIVRDADKVDIVRVFGQSDVHDVLGLTPGEFANGEISDAAMTAVRERRCLSHADRKGSLDGLIGVACLPFEIVNDSAKGELVRLGYLHELLDRPFGLAPTFSSAETRRKYAEVRGALL